MSTQRKFLVFGSLLVLSLFLIISALPVLNDPVNANQSRILFAG